MKSTLLFVIGLVTTSLSFAQIANPSFELNKADSTDYPQNWNLKKSSAFETKLSSIAHTGQKSVCMQSISKNDGQTNTAFSQVIKMDVKEMKKIKISAYIKTKEVELATGILCQVMDVNNNDIAYANLDTQNKNIKGTNEWTQYSLEMTLTPKCKQLKIGAYLIANGTVWFDDFKIEELPAPTEQPTKEVMNYFNTFKKKVKNNSIFADSINWKEVDKEISFLSKGMKTVDESHALCDYLIDKLRSAGDNHSFLLPKTNAEEYAQSNQEKRQPYSKVINGNIGYIYVPSFLSVSDTASINFATKIQNLIKELDTQNNIKGWIVDLSENSGGNMYPMIAGLGPIIGNGHCGYFVYKKTKQNWHYENGKCGAGIGTVVKVKEPYTLKNDTKPVAVLIGELTASSGEMTTISFIGKTNVKLFGQYSAGYTTGNEGYKLSDGAYLYLASSYTADRTNKKYLNNISPDVLVESKEKNVDEAVKWLEGK